MVAAWRSSVVFIFILQNEMHRNPNVNISNIKSNSDKNIYYVWLKLLFPNECRLAWGKKSLCHFHSIQVCMYCMQTLTFQDFPFTYVARLHWKRNILRVVWKWFPLCKQWWWWWWRQRRRRCGWGNQVCLFFRNDTHKQQTTSSYCKIL